MPLTKDEGLKLIAEIRARGCPVTEGDRLAYFAAGIQTAVECLMGAVSLDAKPEQATEGEDDGENSTNDGE